jgi:rhodanese-related sulfurtransferase
MRKKIIPILICLLLITTTVLLAEAKTSLLSEENLMISDELIELINPTIAAGYTDITIAQAYNFLTNTSNGIQIPIDVRSDSEWKAAHIDTPYPENVQHWPNLQMGINLSAFMELYQGKEIILYCQGGTRSTAAANLLVGNNFNGVIYNMLGGISAWISAGYPTTTKDYTNITVKQAYNLLTNTSNGIQKPIDVRTPSEWAIAHIDTPYPENPQHWPYLQMGQNLSKFMELYQGKEIILYCKGGFRSLTAANLLDENNFTGIIYNMLGGIDAWIAAGYPTKPNSFPNIPVISGQNKGKIDQAYQYTFTTTDIDQDDVYYYVNWSDNTSNQLIGPYHSGEEATISHVWSEKGTYTLKVKARDIYGAESDYATFKIKMPYSYNNPIPQLLECLFQRFPHAFLLLRQLLGY